MDFADATAKRQAMDLSMTIVTFYQVNLKAEATSPCCLNLRARAGF